MNERRDNKDINIRKQGIHSVFHTIFFFKIYVFVFPWFIFYQALHSEVGMLVVIVKKIQDTMTRMEEDVRENVDYNHLIFNFIKL